MHPAENAVDPAPAHYYHRIDCIFRQDEEHGQALLELGIRLKPWLLECIERDSPPPPAPTVFRPSYGPVEGYMLRLVRMSESPTPYYRTILFVVYCRPV
jgi:hypothetical protein